MGPYRSTAYAKKKWTMPRSWPPVWTEEVTVEPLPLLS